jgi:hypothetical protein
MADESGAYTLANDDEPRGGYVPPPESRYDEEQAERDREREPESFWVRVMAWDPFPAIMLVSVLLWVAMGLTARKWPPMGLVLGGVGLLVVLVGQLYLYALIFQGGYEHGILSLLFDWYRSIYLHFNIEITLKPMLISGTGLLMMLTGVFMFISKVKPLTG